MSRPTQPLKSIIAALVALLAIAGGSWAYIAHSPSHTASTVTNAQHQLTQLSYPGQQGQTALALLKKHAAVTTKHYSFGDQVISINGVAGSGPKYWTFYVNNKESNIGASSYQTKATDKIMWRLQ